MNKLLFLLSLIFFNTFSLTAQEIKLFEKTDVIEYDSIPYMIKDAAFEEAYAELLNMFNGKTTYSMKRAEFLVENAFYDGKLNYKEFCHDIDSVVNVLKQFISINNLERYKTAPNYAIFEYFTKPSIMNGNKKFTYDFEDPLGENNFSVFFTSRLLRTHKGQCTSLCLLYKILCDELGGHSALAFAPMHLYVKHIGEDGKWVNVELTHGGFVRDIWMIESLNISTEAIRNGIFLCALSDKENIGFMLMQLSRAYQHKYKSYDYFVQRSIDTVLNQLPNFSNALVMKFNLFQDQGLNFQAKYGYKKSPYIDQHYKEFQSVMNKLDLLGYSELTIEEYNANIAEGKRLIEGELQHDKE